MSTPILLTLEEAKLTLRITDPADDPEVTQAIAEASAEICSYLKSATDDTWTPTTTPGDVKASARLLLTHRFENRGDKFEKDSDAEIWAAIYVQLCRRRDPALA